MSEVEKRQGTGALGVMAAFLGGAFVGAVIAILLAPRPGAETRRRILEKAERSSDELERFGTAAKQATAAARAAFTAALQGETSPR